MSAHESVWLATSERPAFPALHVDVDVDVAVVGGGITGLTTALMLQRAGARVALVEGNRIGAGTTGNTTGKITSQHSLAYADLVERHGEDRARQYAEANQWAVTKVAELAGELAPDCRFEQASAYVYDTTGDHRGAIQAEYEAAVRLGLPATLTADVDLPLPVALALRFDEQAHLHPGRYVAGLARGLAAAGATVVEHTRALAVDERDDRAIVRTATGTVSADHVVVATLLPFVDIGGFFAKARPVRSYGIAARLAGDAPAGMHIDTGSPSRSTRPWLDGDRRGLIVVGEGHATGHDDAGPGRWGALERWTRDHFDVESFEYRWSAQDYTTVDELPYVGRSPRTRRTYVATGFRKWGLTNGTAAAAILTELVQGREHRWHEAFDATRIGDAGTVKQLVEENVHVGKRFVRDWAGRLTARSVAHLAPGDGGIVEIDGHVVAAHRRADGSVAAVSATCTHLGCTVQWNGAESSWDCPCHGSRFAADGSVLDAPAVEPLAPVDVDTDDPHRD
jgi:glycine/D-amino acid oxidase-like deaminating enzyme/Rieske Fe-S protein